MKIDEKAQLQEREAEHCIVALLQALVPGTARQVALLRSLADKLESVPAADFPEDFNSSVEDGLRAAALEAHRVARIHGTPVVGRDGEEHPQ